MASINRILFLFLSILLHAVNFGQSVTCTKSCNNGGSCHINSDGQEFCDCLAGYSGPTCDMKLNKCYNNPCKNGGRCKDLPNLRSNCTCPPQFYGKYCEERNPCYNNKECKNNGTCKVKFITIERSTIKYSYTCECSSGYYGTKCEKSKCDPSPCENGANCTVDPASADGYRCICENGFEGPRCLSRKKMCSNNKCENGAKCHEKPNTYMCVCPDNTEEFIYEGRFCKKRARGIHERRYINTTLIRLFQESATTCKNSFDCLNKARNGFCDTECYSEACGMDGGDCGPWASCPVKSCGQTFKDNQCNAECNKANCLFDGFDCDKSRGNICPSTCKNDFHDGICNPECNFWECGFDGGDCLREKHMDRDGYIIVKMNLSRPESIYKQNTLRKVLRSLSIELRSVVQLKYKTDKNNDPEVYIRDNKYGQNVVLMYLTMNSETCQNKNCFNYTSLAVDYLEASLSLKKLPSDLNITKIYYGAQVKQTTKGPSNNNSSIVLVGISIVFMLVVSLTIGLVIHKYQITKAKSRMKIQSKGIWNPATGVKSLNSSETSGYGANGSELSVASSNCPYSLLGGQPNPARYTETTFIFPSEKSRSKLSRELPSLIRPIVTTLENTDGVHPVDNTKRLILLDRMLKQIDPCSADINEPVNDFGESLLHLAARLNSGPDVIGRLIEAGCDIRARDVNNHTPLASAVAADAYDSAQFLLQKEREHQQSSRIGPNRNGKLPSVPGEKRGRTRGTEKRETTPLITAIRAASESSALLLLNEGVPINNVDEQGRNALHWAASTNMVSIMRKLFLMKGAAKIIDQRDDMDRTPIFLAVREGAYQACELLLDYNASVNIPDHNDTLPVQVAIDYGHHSVYELLLRRCRDLCFQTAAPDTSSNPPETCNSHKSSQPMAPTTPMDIDEYTDMSMPHLTAAPIVYDSSSPADSGEGLLMNSSPSGSTKLPPIQAVTENSSYPSIQASAYLYQKLSHVPLNDIYV